MDIKIIDSSINLNSSTIQYLYKYVQHRQTVLCKRIASSTRIIQKMKMRKTDNNGEIYPEFEVEVDEITYSTKQQQMEREEELLKEFCEELEKVIRKGGYSNMQFLLRLSNYVMERIEILDRQYDSNASELVHLKRHNKAIEAALLPFLPNTKMIELPIILIEADHNNDLSIYLKIYDYVCNTLRLVENDMKILKACIMAYKQCYDNVHEEELLRWEKPHLALHHERNKLTEIITYFQNVLRVTPNPSAKDMMREKDFITVTFFMNLDTYLTEKMNIMLKNKVKEENEIHAFNHQRVKLLEKQIDKLREYTEETGLAYEEAMNGKRVQLITY